MPNLGEILLQAAQGAVKGRMQTREKERQLKELAYQKAAQDWQRKMQVSQQQANITMKQLAHQQAQRQFEQQMALQATGQESTRQTAEERLGFRRDKFETEQARLEREKQENLQAQAYALDQTTPGRQVGTRPVVTPGEEPPPEEQAAQAWRQAAQRQPAPPESGEQPADVWRRTARQAGLLPQQPIEGPEPQIEQRPVYQSWTDAPAAAVRGAFLAEPLKQQKAETQRAQFNLTKAIEAWPIEKMDKLSAIMYRNLRSAGVALDNALAEAVKEDKIAASEAKALKAQSLAEIAQTEADYAPEKMQATIDKLIARAEATRTGAYIDRMMAPAKRARTQAETRSLDARTTLTELETEIKSNRPSPDEVAKSVRSDETFDAGPLREVQQWAADKIEAAEPVTVRSTALRVEAAVEEALNVPSINASSEAYQLYQTVMNNIGSKGVWTADIGSEAWATDAPERLKEIAEKYPGYEKYLPPKQQEWLELYGREGEATTEGQPTQSSQAGMSFDNPQESPLAQAFRSRANFDKGYCLSDVQRFYGGLVPYEQGCPTDMANEGYKDMLEKGWQKSAAQPGSPVFWPGTTFGNNPDGHAAIYLGTDENGVPWAVANTFGTEDYIDLRKHPGFDPFVHPKMQEAWGG